jgi:hypothetical protein
MSGLVGVGRGELALPASGSVTTTSPDREEASEPAPDGAAVRHPAAGSRRRALGPIGPVLQELVTLGGEAGPVAVLDEQKAAVQGIHRNLLRLTRTVPGMRSTVPVGVRPALGEPVENRWRWCTDT